MTKSELKRKVAETGSFYFSRDSMKFFGDTMSNYSCSKNPEEIIDRSGNKRQVYALWRKRPVKMGACDPVYFDAITFQKVSVSRMKVG
jgi:hypothetical protein